MPPDVASQAAMPPPTPADWLAHVPLAWRAGLARLGLGWCGLVLLARADWAAMAHQWWQSSTYTHILLVPLILVWLVSMRVGALARLSPLCWWPGLVALAAAVLAWALGRLSGFAEVSEAGAVAMLVGAVPLLLGPRITVGLAFPLAYMGFLVPVGDELIPALQMITARLTVTFVHWSHIRASIDGVFINTPAGLFQVAQACSGVKFLIAMVAFGALAANVCFLSWWRRAGFMAACVVVPVLANGVRAWATVYIAQFVGAKVAGGFDHIVYGWVFFAIVIAGIIGAGWRWFDRPVGGQMLDAEALLAAPGLATAERLVISQARALGGLCAVALVAAAWVGAGESLAAALPRGMALPQVAGWTRADDAPHRRWSPRAHGADRRRLGRYVDDRGDAVDVFFGLYAAQGPGRKADSFGEGAVGERTLAQPETWAWQAPGPAAADARSERLLADGPQSYGSAARLAETTYRTGGLLTGSGLALRLANFRDKALLRPRPTMMLILSAEERPGHDAAAAIAAFRQSIGPLGPWMDRIASGG